MTRILTHLGNTLELLAPDENQIDPRDIAHALSQICRHGGHTRKFYSIAQHSCIVSDLVPEEHKLTALLRHATTAYFGEVVWPLSHVMPGYERIQDQIWLSICKRFWLDSVLPDCICHIEQIVTATEYRDLLPPRPDAFDDLKSVEPLKRTIRPWGIQEARDNYFQRLMDQLGTIHRKKAGNLIAREAPRKPTALFRHAIDVAAEKIEGLCCAAAGITETARAPAEARIPQGKLRRAAKPEAALNAGVRPPAQLAQGYWLLLLKILQKRLTSTLTHPPSLDEILSVCRFVLIIRSRPIGVKMREKVIYGLPPLQPVHSNFLGGQFSIFDLPKQLPSGFQTTFESFSASYLIVVKVITGIFRVEYGRDVNHNPNNSVCKLGIGGSSISIFFRRLILQDHHPASDCSNRPYRLDPGCHCSLVDIPILKCSDQAPKNGYEHDSEPKHPYAYIDDFRQIFSETHAWCLQWSRACATRSRKLAISAASLKKLTSPLEYWVSIREPS